MDCIFFQLHDMHKIMVKVRLIKALYERKSQKYIPHPNFLLKIFRTLSFTYNLMPNL